MDWVQFVQILCVPVALALSAALTRQNVTIGRLKDDLNKARDELAAFKVDVARTYATNNYLKDVETRLGSQLGKMDAKLDRLVERTVGHD